MFLSRANKVFYLWVPVYSLFILFQNDLSVFMTFCEEPIRIPCKKNCKPTLTLSWTGSFTTLYGTTKYKYYSLNLVLNLLHLVLSSLVQNCRLLLKEDLLGRRGEARVWQVNSDRRLCWDKWLSNYAFSGSLFEERRVTKWVSYSKIIEFGLRNSFRC